MRFVINLTVSSADEGKTLLDWLVYHLVDETRSDVLRALKAGRVAINRRPVQDPNHRLVAGAEVGYQEAGDAPDHASPWSRSGAGVLSLSAGDRDD